MRHIRTSSMALALSICGLLAICLVVSRVTLAASSPTHAPKKPLSTNNACTGGARSDHRLSRQQIQTSVAPNAQLGVCMNKLAVVPNSLGAKAELGKSVAPVRRRSTFNRGDGERPLTADPNPDLPTPFPSWCPMPGKTPYGDIYHLDGQCQATAWEIVVTETDSDGTSEPVGTFDYNVNEYSHWDRSNLDILTEIAILPISAYGYGNTTWLTQSISPGEIPGAEACAVNTQGAFSTGVSCSTTSYDFPNNIAYSVSGGQLNGYVEHEASYPPGTQAELYPRMTWGFEYAGEQPVYPRAVTGSTYQITYCDNNLAGISYAGCKAPSYWYTPVLSYSLSGAYPTVAKHIQQSQAAGVAGAPGTGYLTRSYSVYGANNAVACPSTRKPPSSLYSCDEYPFGSTYQGAAASPKSGITFKQCQITNISQSTPSPRWSACYVIATQNSGAGGALNSFWVDNRTLDSDRFYVKIVA